MSVAEWYLPSIVFGPFIGAGVSLLLGRYIGRHAASLMVITAFAAFIQAILAFDGHHALHFVHEWLPNLNIALSFRADPFGIFFALLVSGIGTLVGIYSWSYIPELPPARLGRYYAALMAFMGAMLGVALSDDLFLLFIFWELTSISSFMLIGFWYEQEHARKGALTALQVTAFGGLLMMVGFLIVGLETGTFSLMELAMPAAKAKIGASPLLIPAVLLIFMGALTKSAQWPFHFWLPNAMVAPTPVSTYLHAATMVKAGIFLLGRVLPIFGEHHCWGDILVPIGLLTFVMSAMQAFVDTDLKGILAKTTLSTLGLLTMLYGLGFASQDVLQILTHATYKGTLFLMVGIVEHATHTRDIRLLGGLRTKMPITFIIALLASASMMGIPPFYGFIAKETLYATLIHGISHHGHHAAHTPIHYEIILGLSVLANAFVFAVGCRIIFRVFLGKDGSHTKDAHDAPIGLWISPAILASLALGLGLITPFGEYMANHFSSHPEHLHISLIPSHIEPVLLSLVTVGIGIALFLFVEAPMVKWRADVKAKGTFTMRDLWDSWINLVTKIAIAYSVRWQNGALRWYLGGSLVFAAGLASFALWYHGLSISAIPISLKDAGWYGITICMFTIVAAITVTQSNTRLGTAIAMTINGFFTALLFVWYHSPDILLTQILIETVSTVFLLLILHQMPVFGIEKLSPFQKILNLAVSVLVGVTFFNFVMLSASTKFHSVTSLAKDYLGHSLLEAGGKNAVNVIIVDFRAMDTIGEITVLVLVGLVVFGLLGSRRKTA
ncbi:hypothetical protein TI05_13045 [Achromatium sp. WMS3]|nr:hypothetical protein TI05_13045 [Achromatium sp. WMS3]